MSNPTGIFKGFVVDGPQGRDLSYHEAMIYKIWCRKQIINQLGTLDNAECPSIDFGTYNRALKKYFSWDCMEFGAIRPGLNPRPIFDTIFSFYAKINSNLAIRLYQDLLINCIGDFREYHLDKFPAENVFSNEAIARQTVKLPGTKNEISNQFYVTYISCFSIWAREMFQGRGKQMSPREATHVQKVINSITNEYYKQDFIVIMQQIENENRIQQRVFGS